MQGTGQFPKFVEEGDAYEIPSDGLYLIPTAEVPVTNLHREELLDGERLPIAYAAYSPCFRREAGAAGKDTRGLLRVHQFDKVELVRFERPERSEAALEELTGPRRARPAAPGAPLPRAAAGRRATWASAPPKTYDLEVWAPGVEKWLEVSSCSNFRDYQARRAEHPLPSGAGREAGVRAHAERLRAWRCRARSWRILENGQQAGRLGGGARGAPPVCGDGPLRAPEPVPCVSRLLADGARAPGRGGPGLVPALHRAARCGRCGATRWSTPASTSQILRGPQRPARGRRGADALRPERRHPGPRASPSSSPTPTGSRPSAATSPSRPTPNDPRDLPRLLRVRAASWRRRNPPLVEPGLGTIYFGDPPLVRRLRWIPWLQVGALACLLAAACWMIRHNQRVERERIWATMARESAHQMATPLSSLAGWVEILRLPPDERDEMASLPARGRRDGGGPGPAGEGGAPLRVDRPARAHGAGGRARPPADPGALRAGPHAAAGARGGAAAWTSPTRSRPCSGNAVLLEWALENLVKNALDALARLGRAPSRCAPSASRRAAWRSASPTTGPASPRRSARGHLRAGRDHQEGRLGRRASPSPAASWRACTTGASSSLPAERGAPLRRRRSRRRRGPRLPLTETDSPQDAESIVHRP